NPGSEEDSTSAKSESAPVARALLPVRDQNLVTVHPLVQTESASDESPAITTSPVDPSSIDPDSTSAHKSSTPIKRSDVLQSELSSYPTSITDRVLSDLRSHGDNPVDRALAELLSEQLSGNNAHPLPQSSNSDSVSDAQQDDHVHHANNPDEEHP